MASSSTALHCTAKHNLDLLCNAVVIYRIENSRNQSNRRWDQQQQQRRACSAPCPSKGDLCKFENRQQQNTIIKRRKKRSRRRRIKKKVDGWSNGRVEGKRQKAATPVWTRINGEEKKKKNDALVVVVVAAAAMNILSQCPIDQCMIWHHETRSSSSSSNDFVLIRKTSLL